MPSDYLYPKRKLEKGAYLKKNAVPSVFGKADGSLEPSSPKRNAPANFSISPSKLQRISIEFHNYSKPLSEEPATSGEPISTGEPTIPDICPSLDNKDADQDNHKSETLTNKRLKKVKSKGKKSMGTKNFFLREGGGGRGCAKKKSSFYFT